MVLKLQALVSVREAESLSKPMRASLVLDNATAYDVTRFDVRLGEVFRVELQDAPNLVRWFVDNDPVLSIDVHAGGRVATITATKTGDCEIQLEVRGNEVKTLRVSVFSDEAIRLNLLPGKAEPK